MSLTNPRMISGKMQSLFVQRVTKLCLMQMVWQLYRKAIIMWPQEADWLSMVRAFVKLQFPCLIKVHCSMKHPLLFLLFLNDAICKYRVFPQKHNHRITEMPTSGDLKSGDSLSFTALGISTTHAQDIKQILMTGSLCVKGEGGQVVDIGSVSKETVSRCQIPRHWHL